MRHIRIAIAIYVYALINHFIVKPIALSVQLRSYVRVFNFSILVGSIFYNACDDHQLTIIIANNDEIFSDYMIKPHSNCLSFKRIASSCLPFKRLEKPYSIHSTIDSRGQ